MGKMKKYLLCLLGIMTILSTTTSCTGEMGPVEKFDLMRSWKLTTIYGVPVDVNLYIDFGRDGKFTICQLTEDYTYVVFSGVYTTTDKGEKSVLSGVYDDGEPWTNDYYYEVDKENRELVLESLDNPSEVAVYKPAAMPNNATRTGVIYTTTNINRPL